MNMYFVCISSLDLFTALFKTLFEIWRQQQRKMHTRKQFMNWQLDLKRYLIITCNCIELHCNRLYYNFNWLTECFWSLNNCIICISLTNFTGKNMNLIVYNFTILCTSSPLLRLWRLVTPRPYGAQFSRSIRYGCWPLVPNFPTELTRLTSSICYTCQFGHAERKLAGSSGTH